MAAAEQGRRVFETTACVNCHTISGTVANGRFGPDLTHLMSRDTIASGAAPNTPEQLRTVDSKSRRDQTGLVDAGNAAERTRSGRAHRVSGDASMRARRIVMASESIAIIAEPPRSHGRSVNGCTIGSSPSITRSSG